MDKARTAASENDGSSTKHARTLVLDLYQAFDSGRLDDFAERVGSNFAAQVLGTTALDWMGFKQFGDAFRCAFPDGRHVFDRVLADGQSIVTIGTYRGTHTGALQGMAPTNRQIELQVMHFDRVIDGKIVEHHGLANELDFMRQLGAATAARP